MRIVENRILEVIVVSNDVNYQNLNSKKQSNPLFNIINDTGFVGMFKSIGCIGDSLTQGVFDRTNNTELDWNETSFYSYPSILQRKTGAKVFNLGYKGTTACDSIQARKDCHSWLEKSEDNLWFTEKYKSVAYIISIGTNDIKYYGEFTGDVSSDIDVNNYLNNNCSTSVGGLATIIQKCRELQPNAVIFVETIDNTRNTTECRKSANKKIREICEKLNCELLDFEKYWIQLDEVEEWKSNFQNGEHLNALGYFEKTMARITYIDWIIRNNPKKFKNIQFIGTINNF